MLDGGRQLIDESAARVEHMFLESGFLETQNLSLVHSWEIDDSQGCGGLKDPAVMDSPTTLVH